MEPATVIDILRSIPFAVCSIAERCTDQGSYSRAIAERVYLSIRADIEAVIKRLEKEKPLSMNS